MTKFTNNRAQQEALDKSKDRREFAYFMEPGIGKTRTTLQDIRRLYVEKKIDRALIFAPAGVYAIWEDNEIPKHLDLDPKEFDIHTWLGAGSVTEKNRIKKKMFVKSDKLKILIMNIESVSNSTYGVKTALYFLSLGPSYVAFDESTTLKNPDSRRSKSAHDIGDAATFSRILTGTPMTGSPLDVYSQLRAITQKPLGHSNFYSFRARYAVMQTMMINGRSIKTVKSFKNMDELRRKMDEIGFFASKKDYLDLPPKVNAEWYVEPTAQQLRLIEELREQWFSQIGDVETEVVLVKNVLGLSLRIRQILSGFVRDQFSGEDVQIDSNRTKNLMELLEYQGPGTVIWAPFHFNHYEIAEKLGKKVAIYTGETDKSERTDVIKSFEDGTKDYFLGSQSAGGRGITLVRGSKVIFYMNDQGVERRIQTEDRCHRQGQLAESVLYTDMMCKGHNDEKLAYDLRKGVDLSGEFMTKRAASEFLFGSAFDGP